MLTDAVDICDYVGNSDAQGEFFLKSRYWFIINLINNINVESFLKRGN